jgi:hypothetical protein
MKSMELSVRIPTMPSEHGRVMSGNGVGFA